MSDTMTTPAERRQAFWNGLRWFALALSLAGGIASVALLRRPEEQSLWMLERIGRMSVFIEKSAPAEGAADLLQSLARAGERMRAAGVDPGQLAEIELVVFIGIGSFGSLAPDDPLLSRHFAGRSPDLRLLRMIGRRRGLGERAAPCYVTDDGRFLFIDLGREPGDVVYHALAHALARTRVPEGVRSSIVASNSYRAEDAAAFAFLDEGAALFIEDFVGVGGDPELYAERSAPRFDPEGEFMAGEALDTLFSADTRDPGYFAAAASFTAILAEREGLPAAADWTGRFLRGEYASLDELTAVLGISPAELAGVAVEAGG